MLICLIGSFATMLMDAFWGFPLQLPCSVLLFWFLLAMIEKYGKIAEHPAQKKIEMKVGKRKIIVILVILPVLLLLYFLSVRRIYGEYYKRMAGDFARNDITIYEKYLSRSIRYNPFDYSTRLSLTNVLVAKGDYDGALEQINKAQTIGNIGKAGYKELGIIHLKRKQLNEAFKYLKKALLLSPKDPETYEYLAVVAISQKSFSDALRYLAQAIEQDNLRPNSFYLYGRIQEEYKRTMERRGTIT